MNNGIYDSPSTDPGHNVESSRNQGERPKLLLIAFFAAPLLTVGICIFVVLFFDALFDNGKLINAENPGKTLLDGSLLGVAALYGYPFVFGLSTHWLPAKFAYRKIYLYFLAGILWLVPFILLTGMQDMLLADFALLVAGAVAGICFTIFWAICVYLPARRRLLLALVVFAIPIPVIAGTWNDVSKLNPVEVGRIVAVGTEADVVEALRSRSSGERVVISGTRHSQGGHIVYPGAIVLDMSSFDRVLSVSPGDKTVVVQSGATWSQVQRAANRHGLAVKVMQSSNIFSIGGSISANVHGRDPRYGPLIETVRSLKIVLHDGEIVRASRDRFPDLFRAAIGGYGLLGVILEAEIELTDNLPLSKSTRPIAVEDYSASLAREAGKKALHYGRCSFVKDDTFLRECYSTDFYESATGPVVSELSPEKNIERNSLIFRASRESNLGKLARWSLQKELVDVPGELVAIERNNAMRPPVRFLDYDSSEDTDILQEYFVPGERFAEYLEQLRSALLSNEVNLLSVTLRYLRKNRESLLSYSGRDMIAVVLYINIDLNDQSIARAKGWTRDLVDLALRHGGTYYLTYQRFPTLEQFEEAYPNWENFMAVKCKYDPGEVFANKFYEDYLRAAFVKRNSPDKTLTGVPVCR